MRSLFGRILLLLPVALTGIPLSEMLLPMYYLAPSPMTAAVIFAFALTLSCVQMFYQYWAVGEVERLAPSWAKKAGIWLDRQPLVCMIRQQTGPMLFLFGLCPGIRVFGTTLWQTTRYRGGGLLLAAGTAIQLALIFGGMLGLGQLIRGLFR